MPTAKTPPCEACGHPIGTHNRSYGCQRKGCSCQEHTAIHITDDKLDTTEAEKKTMTDALTIRTKTEPGLAFLITDETFRKLADETLCLTEWKMVYNRDGLNYVEFYPKKSAFLRDYYANNPRSYSILENFVAIAAGYYLVFGPNGLRFMDREALETEFDIIEDETR